jgi:hypothetical protein
MVINFKGLVKKKGVAAYTAIVFLFPRWVLSMTPNHGGKDVLFNNYKTRYPSRIRQIYSCVLKAACSRI